MEIYKQVAILSIMLNWFPEPSLTQIIIITSGPRTIVEGEQGYRLASCMVVQRNTIHTQLPKFSFHFYLLNSVYVYQVILTTIFHASTFDAV